MMEIKEKMTEIKCCPHCGNDTAVIVLDQNEVDFIDESSDDYSKDPYFQVVCSMNEDHSPVPIADWHPGCGASGGYRKTKEQAIEAWNKRVGDDELREHITAIEFERACLMNEIAKLKRTVMCDDGVCFRINNRTDYWCVNRKSNREADTRTTRSYS